MRLFRYQQHTPVLQTIIILVFSSLYLLVAMNVSANTNPHFDAIRALIDDRALESAIAEMKLKADKDLLDNAQVTILSAMFFAESGQPGKALDLIDKAEFMTTQHETAIAEAKARAYLKQGDLSKAYEMAQSALDQDNGNLVARLIMVEVDGEVSGTLQRQPYEQLLRQSSNDPLVWLSYLDQALRFEPQNTTLADRAYIDLGDTGSMIEYRAQFNFLGGDPYDAHILFKQARARYLEEGNTIAANRIERWLNIHKKFAKRPTPPKVKKQKPPQEKPNTDEPRLKRENLPGPKLTPAVQDGDLEIEPIEIQTDGDIYTGSGFITNSGQWIITNRHVIEGAERAVVRDGLGKVRHVKEYYLDENQDIALLVLHSPFPADQAIRPRDIIDPAAGDELFLMGYPLAGVLGAHHPSITEGIVSKQAGFDNEATEFLITANLNQGNSGGPIFSTDGRVLGIAVAKLNKTKFLKENDSIPEDVNIGIKGKEVRRFLEFDQTPSSDARPIMSPRDAYTALRSKVVLIVAVDE